MLKCSKCNTLKEESEFVKANNKRGYTYSCKSCIREYSKEHYHNNKESYLKKNSTHRAKVLSFINNYKTTQKCSICGESRYWCLDFHHIKDKEFNIGSLARYTSLNKVKKEIEKCIVVCANCHRDIHHTKRLL